MLGVMVRRVMLRRVILHSKILFLRVNSTVFHEVWLPPGSPKRWKWKNKDQVLVNLQLTGMSRLSFLSLGALVEYYALISPLFWEYIYKALFTFWRCRMNYFPNRSNQLLSLFHISSVLRKSQLFSFHTRDINT